MPSRALRALVKELRTRKRAATDRARPPSAASRSEAEPDETSGTAPERDQTRYIPASTRRAVFDRDGARCAYQDNRGERCRETFGLEIHHRRAHALGGPPTLDNLELRCRAHNTLAAEDDFGRKHMNRMRDLIDDAAPEREFAFTV